MDIFDEGSVSPENFDPWRFSLPFLASVPCEKNIGDARMVERQRKTCDKNSLSFDRLRGILMQRKLSF